MLLVTLDGKTPRVHASAFVAPNATLIGDVEIGEQASVWFGCVLRGDVGPIQIGARSNVQDLSCIHATDGISHTSVGEDVTVGHGVILHGCTVEDRALIRSRRRVVQGIEDRDAEEHSPIKPQEVGIG